MSHSNKLIFLIVLILLGGLSFLVWSPTESKNVTPTSQNPVPQNTVLMTENGFEPEILTIKAGTKVSFVNSDKAYRWPASDLHPTHTIYPEFDPKAPVEPGTTWEFVFDRIGTWNYHDHLSPLLTGKIIVE